MQLKLVPNAEINKTAWDQCVDASATSLRLCKSDALDILAPDWSAFTNADYSICTPAISRRKFGIRYLYQPVFLPAVDVFSKDRLTGSMRTEVITLLLQHFKFAEIMINHASFTDTRDLTPYIISRTNYILSLQQSHESLSNNYSSDFKKSLRRIGNKNPRYESDDDYRFMISWFQKLYAVQSGVNKDDLQRFTQLCTHLHSLGQIHIRKAFSADRALWAGMLFIDDGKRLLNVISCISDAGRRAEANYFLYDSVFKEFAGSREVFDFEGSDIPGVAEFYRKMGPREDSHSFVKLNKLPGLLRYLK